MAGYLSTRRRSPTRCEDLPGVRVVPDPPQVPMMHLMLATGPEDFAAAARRLAAEQGVWTWPRAMATADPGAASGAIGRRRAPAPWIPARSADLIAALSPSLRGSAAEGPAI